MTADDRKVIFFAGDRKYSITVDDLRGLLKQLNPEWDEQQIEAELVRTGNYSPPTDQSRR
jgi:hypothetical protein